MICSCCILTDLHRTDFPMKNPPPDWLSLIQPRPRIVGSARVAADWCLPPREIYDHELVLVRMGVMEMEIAGRVIPCPAPSYVIVPPGVLHTSRMVEGKGALHWVHFDWHGRGGIDLPVMCVPPAKPAQSLLRKAPRWVPEAIFHGAVSEHAEVFALHGRIEKAWNLGLAHERRLCRPWLHELLLHLLDHEGRERGESMGPPRHAALLDAVRAELDRLSGLPMRKCPLLGCHLQTFGTSYEHILRIFQRANCLTPSDYISEIRLQKARALLINSPATIGEIADRVGFTSTAYFCRVFKKRHGTNPGSWRRSHRTDD